MEYVIEDLSSDKSTLNSAQSSVGTTEHLHVSIVDPPEPEFFSPTLEERFRSDEAFLRRTSKDLEHRRDEADRLHRAHDEKERLAALEDNRSSTEQQAQERNEREQRLLAEIDALRDAEAQQRQRIEDTTAPRPRPSGNETQQHSDIAPATDHHVEEAETQLAQLEALHGAAKSQATARATETARLNSEIRTLSQMASAQIDRMDQAKARLAILEELRIHAETKVCERAEREIRLEAEIDALRQIEATQAQRIEAAEGELQRLTEEQTRVQAAAEAHQIAQAEARLRGATEAAEKAANEARHLAEKEEQELERLETIRARAEAASQERAEKERLLNSQLLGFGEAAAEQLKRIERAEADLSKAEEEFLQLEVKARETEEQAAIRLAETEMRQQAAINEIAKAEAETQATANAVEQHLAELKAIYTRAEAEAKQRSEIEHQLNAGIEALRETEAQQLRRIEKAKAVAQGMSEQQTELLRIATVEEQRLIELESARKEFETTSQHRYEEEQRLMAEIEALREIGSEQFARIVDAQRAIQTKEIELRAPEISQEEVELQIGSEVDLKAKSGDWSGNLQSVTPASEAAAHWSLVEPGDQSSGDPAKSVEFPSTDSVNSRVESPETLSREVTTEDSAKLSGAVVPDEATQADTQETSLVNSLAKRLSSGDQDEYDNVVHELRDLNDNVAFDLLTDLFDGGTEEVKNAAARALSDLGQERTDFFTPALREASPERTGQIVKALEAAGLAAKAIDSLAGESRDKTHDAFSMLFFMAKAGEVQSLFHTIEKHPNIHVRLSVIKLLTFTNRPDIIPALRSLAVRGALPIEVRSALMNSIYEMSSSHRERSLSAA
jgi:hypothetical protein